MMTNLTKKTIQKYLKDQTYYSDLYDRHTVERCRNLVKLHSQPMKNPPLLDGKKPSKAMVDTVSKMALEWSLMFETGDRYIRKEETVREWMDADEARDNLYESAEPPVEVRCLKCRSVMAVLDKNLWTRLNEPDRVLFMFDCPNGCLPRRAFYDDGEEWQPKPDLCPKCGQNLKAEGKSTKTKFITRYKCLGCGYAKTDELKRTVSQEEQPDPNFDADRVRFCLTKEAGEKWRQELYNMEQMKKLVDEMKERDKNKEFYDKVAKIKKLTVIALEQLLAPALEKAGYVHIQLANPEIDRNVVVPFTMQDSKSDREGRSSEYYLKQLLKKTLEGTNWRLMTDSVSYRLGVLSGRLRGYESEEDLVKLVKVVKDD